MEKQDNQKAIVKIEIMNYYTSIITWNVNELHSPIKSHRVDVWGGKYTAYKSLISALMPHIGSK